MIWFEGVPNLCNIFAMLLKRSLLDKIRATYGKVHAIAFMITGGASQEKGATVGWKNDFAQRAHGAQVHRHF